MWKANGVSVENLTVCNFLGGADDSGNEVWWNGGADTGKIGLHGYTGRYLTATSTYFGGEATAAQYGIFSSDAQGPAPVGPDCTPATSTTPACTSAPACRCAT